MCGRYYIEIDDRELQDICDAVSRENDGRLEIKLSGEIFPTNIVPTLAGLKHYQAMKWGFAGFDGRPIINARKEAATAKPMFRDCLLHRRCLIPASGYYEWQKDGSRKIKYRFYTPGKPIYLAGCFRQETGSPLRSFVILTQEARGGLKAIHGRMPVIIPPADIESWFKGADIDIFNPEIPLFQCAPL